MRHKYETRGLVLARHPLGEASVTVTILTPALGLVRARAQGLRRSGAKLAPALVTFAESDLVLVGAKEGWRVAGAVLEKHWSQALPREARERATKVIGLLLRLVQGEERGSVLFGIVQAFFEALETVSGEMLEAVELLTVLRVLAALGFDAGEIPGAANDFSPAILNRTAANRQAYISRINDDLAASGL